MIALAPGFAGSVAARGSSVARTEPAGLQNRLAQESAAGAGKKNPGCPSVGPRVREVTMVAVTLLEFDRQRARVRQATPPLHEIRSVSTVGEARAMLWQKPADVLVIDPFVRSTVLESAAGVPEFFAIGTDFPYLPVVFYASNATAALPVVAAFPTRERCAAVVLGVHDSPDALGKLILSLVSASLVGRIVERLRRGRGGSEPAGTFRAIRHALMSPSAFHTADDLAAVACTSRRTLDRSLKQLGFVSAAQIIEVGRALVALRLLRDGDAVSATSHSRRPRGKSAAAAKLIQEYSRDHLA